MTISSNCKKMMAFVTAITLILSILFVPGNMKKAAAATVKPTVTVLGATIRLNDDRNDNQGTQSMMIGIRVDRADKASACAITLTSGTRSYTVATSADKIGERGKVQTTVHSKDESAKSIVYAVVVTGIGSDNFYSNIGIQGKVWNLEGTEYNSGAIINKNVAGIVSALQSAYPSLHITIKSDGIIYKGNGASPLTAADLANAGGNAEDPAPVPTPSVVAFDAEGNNLGSGVINQETGDIEIGDTASDPVRLALPIDPVNVGETIQVHITGTVNEGGSGFRLWPCHGNGDSGNNMAGSGGEDGRINWYQGGDPGYAEGAFDITKNIKVVAVDNQSHTYADYIMIKAPYGGELKHLVVSSVDVVNLGNLTPPTPAPTPNYGWDNELEYYTLELNSTNVTRDGGANISYNFDNSVSISSNGDYPGIWFRLPQEAQVPMDSVTFTYEGVEGDGFGCAYRYTDSLRDEGISWGGKFTSSSTTETINFNDQKTNVEGVKFFIASTGVTNRSVTVTSAVFHAADVPSPTAVPAADIYAVRKPNGNITIDGNANEAAWSTAIEYPFKYYSGTKKAAGAVASAKLMWDDSNIYGLVDVLDNDIASGSGTNWRRDGLDIYLDEDNSKENSFSDNQDAFRYMFAGLKDNDSNFNHAYYSKGESVESKYGSDLYNSTASDTKIARTLKTGGYTIEFRLPLYRKALLNKVVGFDMAINDCHSDSNDSARDNEVWFSGSSKNGTSKSNLWNTLSVVANMQLVNSVALPAPASGTDGHTLAHFSFENSTYADGEYTSVDGCNAKAVVYGSLGSDNTTWFGSKSANFNANGYTLLNLLKSDGTGLLDDYGKDELTISYWSRVTNSSSTAFFSFSAEKQRYGLSNDYRQYFSVRDLYSQLRTDRAATSDNSFNKLDLTNVSKREGSWNHIVIVVDGKTTRTYLNGELVGTNAPDNNKLFSALFTGETDFFIGGRPWTGGYNYFEGAIDEFIVKDVALSDSEVAAMYDDYSNEMPLPTATPIAMENFSDIVVNSGTPVASRVSTEIMADGIQEAVWGDLPYYNIGSGSFAKAKVAWDDNYLYALVRTNDTTLDYSSNNDWERHGGELFLDENNSKEDSYSSNSDAFQFRYTGFSPAAQSANKYTHKFTAGSDTAKSAYAAIEYGNQIDSQLGYIIEYKVPWSNPGAISLGKVIGFDLSAFKCADGSRTKEYMFISQDGNKWQNPSVFGTIRLSGEPGSEEPAEVPYTSDLSQWSVEHGSPSVTIDNGIAALTTGFGGVLFTDVPGDEYKYVVITYKKSGGDVNVYPDQDTEYKISDATDYTSVILSPQRTSGSQKVKVFNFGGTVTVYIKSIEFYKNDPSL